MIPFIPLCWLVVRLCTLSDRQQSVKYTTEVQQPQQTECERALGPGYRAAFIIIAHYFTHY